MKAPRVYGKDKCEKCGQMIGRNVMKRHVEACGRKAFDGRIVNYTRAGCSIRPHHDGVVLEVKREDWGGNFMVAKRTFHRTVQGAKTTAKRYLKNYFLGRIHMTWKGVQA